MLGLDVTMAFMLHEAMISLVAAGKPATCLSLSISRSPTGEEALNLQRQKSDGARRHALLEEFDSWGLLRSRAQRQKSA